MPEASVSTSRDSQLEARLPGSHLTLDVVRPLSEEDVSEIEAARAVASPAPTRPRLASIRHSHHQLARLLAQGGELEYVSLVTGYSPAYISSIKSDPMFAELMAYYASQATDENIDAMKRLATLGLDAVDELQSRLADNPDGFTTNQLMGLAELAIAKPAATVAGLRAFGASAQTPVQVNVVFGKEAARPPLIEGTIASSSDS